MDLRSLAADTVTSAYNRIVGAAKELSPSQLTWQPAPDVNHAGFLIFHTFRVMDRHFHRQLSPQGELWERNKWHRQFPIPTPPPNAPSGWFTGNGWTIQEMNSFRVNSMEQLLAYGDSVYQSGMRKLQTLDVSDLDRMGADEVAKLSVGTILTRVCVHPFQHAGQLDYLVGLMKQRGIL